MTGYRTLRAIFAASITTWTLLAATAALSQDKLAPPPASDRPATASATTPAATTLPPPTTPTVPPPPPAKPEPPERVRLHAITFDFSVKGGVPKGPAGMYVALRAAAEQLGWTVDASDGLKINGQPVVADIRTRRLLDGTRVLTLSDLKKIGASIYYDEVTGVATVASGNRAFEVAPGEKRVEVDIATQMLTAYQGDLVVMKFPISTGRPGHRTPTGQFTTGPEKSRIHYSSLYNEAPMPYAVQFNGNIFFHGYDEVPAYPASHGCVRMPMTGINPAKQFYHWAERGMSVTVAGEWKGRRRSD